MKQGNEVAIFTALATAGVGGLAVGVSSGARKGAIAAAVMGAGGFLYETASSGFDLWRKKRAYEILLERSLWQSLTPAEKKEYTRIVWKSKHSPQTVAYDEEQKKFVVNPLGVPWAVTLPRFIAAAEEAERQGRRAPGAGVAGAGMNAASSAANLPRNLHPSAPSALADEYPATALVFAGVDSASAARTKAAAKEALARGKATFPEPAEALIEDGERYLGSRFARLRESVSGAVFGQVSRDAISAALNTSGESKADEKKDEDFPSWVPLKRITKEQDEERIKQIKDRLSEVEEALKDSKKKE